MFVVVLDLTDKQHVNSDLPYYLPLNLYYNVIKPVGQ